MFKLRGTDKVEIIQVIKTETLIGDGTAETPARTLIQYWDFNGNLIGKHDTIEDSIDDDSLSYTPYQ